MDNYLSLLKGVDLFKGVCLDNISDLMNSNLAYIKNYKKNSVIYFEYDECISCDIILDGSIVIQDIDRDGNTLTIKTFNKLDVLGENLLFTNHCSYPLTIISKSDSCLLHIKKELILMLCQRDSTFLSNLLSSLSNKTIILKDRIKDLSTRSIRDNIIKYLIHQSNIQNSTTIKLTCSKKELSEIFGISRTSLSRELNKMKNENLIDYDSKSITILDLQLLSI